MKRNRRQWVRLEKGWISTDKICLTKNTAYIPALKKTLDKNKLRELFQQISSAMQKMKHL